MPKPVGRPLHRFEIQKRYRTRVKDFKQRCAALQVLESNLAATRAIDRAAETCAHYVSQISLHLLNCNAQKYMLGHRYKFRTMF